MNQYTEYPLSFGNISPGNNFVKMNLGLSLENVQEGLHTGGPWLSPDGAEVWKPLDARPHPGADSRLSTNEADCLEEMADRPGFPRNWRIEERNGRRWLVRPWCHLWPQSDRLVHADQNTILLVESAVRDLNYHGWEAFGSDVPQLALDPNGDWFLLDLSAAFKPTKWQTDWHGDRERVIKWFRLVGYEWLANLRKRGQHIHHAVMLPGFNDTDLEPYNVEDVFYPMSEEERRTHVHIYASQLRSLSRAWCKIDGTRFLCGDPDRPPRVYSWVVSDHLLDAETAKSYELIHAYSPWP